MRPGPLALLALGLAAVPAAAAQPEGCRPTLSQYRTLKTGITVAQARRHLGCRGSLVSRLGFGKTRRTVYTWYGRGTYGANLTLTFTDGRLTDRFQLGLR